MVYTQDQLDAATYAIKQCGAMVLVCSEMVGTIPQVSMYLFLYKHKDNVGVPECCFTLPNIYYYILSTCLKYESTERHGPLCSNQHQVFPF